MNEVFIMRFFKGCFWGLLLAIPFWIIVIWLISKWWSV
ncbi:hypothetical protein CN373_09780 [Bacillus cereus]|uniref:Uncharacterized protein n=1 Tax=Bacillus cereus TaxID=1396 RepID=A0AA44TEX8_BACCE|nr:hypothetical protein CN373_09780 [Bacillus cereus]PFN06530.1 hypothetical protein COJ55_14210 [Bacillus cereus]PFO84935.1 hypothetical protein COJ77_03635 [Bacillus cereus]PFR24200.1 hypothetical protein COK19_18765 [Bacillus cereus]PFS01908.1 hypothetical protein COK38_10575 [Bacillus cereus]